MQCWAQYPVGSTEYNANYVSQADLIGLQKELDWVNSQQANNLFVDTDLQKFGDALNSGKGAFANGLLNMVPGKQMADQAQAAFANGNYGAGVALAVGSLGDAALGVLTGGESSTVEQLVSGTKSAGVQISQRGLDLVSSHLSQFGDDAANTGMLERLQSAFASGQTASGADANFYLHEISEATMMSQGLTYDAAHAAAIAKYGVSPFNLYAPAVIDANPTLFNNAWRAAAGLPPIK